MPTYVYEVIKKDGSSGEQFEIAQSIKDAPLEKHPETGEPVRRMLTVPLVLGTSLGANSDSGPEHGHGGHHCCGGGCRH
jgi:predicted nucleic acid-binding Zn ribbon protein